MRIGRQPERQAGFTYLIMLYVLALFGLGLAAIGESWSQAARREKEQAWLQIGQVYACAVRAYHEGSPGSLKHYPSGINDLLEDPRFIGVQRYLRRAYPDPLSAEGGWEIIRAPDGGMMGVYSTNNELTLARMPQILADGITVRRGERYSDWKFFYQVKQ